jgi:hypothetical protein
MMKKSRNRRRRTAKLTAKDIIRCKFFMNIGKSMNAHKVELKFQRYYNTMGSVVFIDDASHKQTIIRLYDHRYYALRYGAKEAKTYNMTLAMWKTINND